MALAMALILGLLDKDILLYCTVIPLQKLFFLPVQLSKSCSDAEQTDSNNEIVKNQVAITETDMIQLVDSLHAL